MDLWLVFFKISFYLNATLITKELSKEKNQSVVVIMQSFNFGNLDCLDVAWQHFDKSFYYKLSFTLVPSSSSFFVHANPSY